MQRIKIVSDLLIAVSKAERQEARMRIRQESFRLGNVGVMRFDFLSFFHCHVQFLV